MLKENTISKKKLFLKKWIECFHEFPVIILLVMCCMLLIIKKGIDSEVLGVFFLLLLTTFVSAITETYVELK